MKLWETETEKRLRTVFSLSRVSWAKLLNPSPALILGYLLIFFLSPSPCSVSWAKLWNPCSRLILGYLLIFFLSPSPCSVSWPKWSKLGVETRPSTPPSTLSSKQVLLSQSVQWQKKWLILGRLDIHELFIILISAVWQIDCCPPTENLVESAYCHPFKKVVHVTLICFLILLK